MFGDIFFLTFFILGYGKFPDMFCGCSTWKGAHWNAYHRNQILDNRNAARRHCSGSPLSGCKACRLRGSVGSVPIRMDSSGARPMGSCEQGGSTASTSAHSPYRPRVSASWEDSQSPPPPRTENPRQQQEIIDIWSPLFIYI